MKRSLILLTLSLVIFFKFIEIQTFDKDKNLDMAQIRGLDLHIKTVSDFFLPYPTKNGTYRWSVTGFGFLYLAQKYISGNLIYFILSGALFLISYFLSYRLSKSFTFSLVYSFLLSLGYNFFIVFFDTRVLALIPFLIYGSLNFITFYNLYILGDKRKIMRFYFIIGLIFLALSWDGWIDYPLALMALVFIIKRKENKKFILYSLSSTIFVYLLSRFLLIGHFNELLGPGREQDFIFNYDSWLLGFEDFTSNIIRYIHTALTNYFPIMPLNPLVLNSPNPIDLINAFSPGATFQQDAIYYNYLYNWYLWAGITFSIYLFYSYQILKKKSFILTSGIIFIFFGGFTHYFIKFRPLLILPYNYSYRQLWAIVGITLILAYFAEYIFKNKIRGKKTGITFLILYCLCFTGMSFFKTKKAIDHSFIHNKLNLTR